ncbi:hypothetical protein DdX_00571 [Ditylenchus destructor]|uniref:Uncharacterized protein n=1 Tax=Ditylenchus destructor TaxID=166010 RepID=A0AAD4NFF2_9BILA|nr:hypothetical protein DdX_00571 [Ditylenchus destructor]
MATSLTFFIALVCGIVGFSNAQMVTQCQCSDIEPCKAAYLNTIQPCMDQCQQHASAMGANYAQIKQCLMQHEPKLRATVACAEGMHSDACARGSPQMVPKRYPETLKIAALSEINKMLSKSGISGQAQSLLSVGKKIYGCVQSCMNKKAGNCEKKLKCGLSLPSDQVLVQHAKQCAIQSGFNTATAQQLCNCVAAAGVKQLAGICGKIQIS